MREFRYFPNASSFSCELADTTKEVDPTIVRLVQFSTAQGLLLGGILGEFKAMDSGIMQAIGAAYRAGRQGSAQAVDPLLPSPVLSSQVVPPFQVVLPSQPVDECHLGTVNADPTNSTILQLYRQGLLQQGPGAAPGVESRLAELLDFGKHLSLRPPGEPKLD